MTQADILRSLLEPSAKIDEKYQTHVFTTKSGKTVTGMILEETTAADQGDREPAGQDRAGGAGSRDIEEHAKSPTSIMPKGLLDKLTSEEILDLIAYIAARGRRPGPAVSWPARARALILVQCRMLESQVTRGIIRTGRRLTTCRAR